MSNSILTNTSAMTALRVLNNTNSELSKTQNRISTGLKVSNAKDNASFWAVSTIMKSDVAAFKAIKDNLALAEQAMAVARDGAQGMSKDITTLKEKVTAAQAGSIDKNKLQRDIDGILSGLANTVETANFNGVMLLKEDTNVRLLSSIGRQGGDIDASYIEFTARNLSFGPNGGLRMIEDLSVLNRGETMLENQLDAVQQVQLGDMAAAPTKDDVLDFRYRDSNGNVRTFSYTIKNTYTNDTDGALDLVDELNNDAAFAKLFHMDYVEGIPSFVLTPASRDTDIKIGTGDATDDIVGNVFTGSPISDVDALVQTSNFEFKDEPLRVNEEIALKFTIAGVEQEVVLRSTDNKTLTGTRLDDKTNPNRVVLALDSRVVSWPDATGADIATEISKALDSLVGANAAGVDNSADGYTAIQSAAAAAGTNINYGFTGNTFTLTSAAGGTDSIQTSTLPVTDYDALLDNLEVALNTAIDAAAALGSAQYRIEIQTEFLSSMIDNLNAGIGTLIDADMSEESARLQALQVQQQLGIQALSIANQSPQALLSLFQ